MQPPAFWRFSWRKHFRVALVLSVLAAVAWLWRQGVRNPAIPLLPPGGAAWIVFPTPPHAEINLQHTVSAEFVRELALAAAPTHAEISMRGFRVVEIAINGVTLPGTTQPAGNWKNVSRVNVASYLRAGTNTISATVTNDNGPPASSLRLNDRWRSRGHGRKLERLGGRFCVASGPAGFGRREVRRGQRASRPGQTGPALRECWPWLCVFLIVAVLLAGGLEFALNLGMPARARAMGLAGVGSRLGLAGRCCFCTTRHCCRARSASTPPLHLEYITYIQKHWSLPSPKQGWEMFQGPLYYVVSACLLGLAPFESFAIREESCFCAV